MRFLFEEKVRKNFASLTKWFEAFITEAAFVQVFGKVRLCVQQLPVHHAHAEKKAEPKKAEKKVEEPKKKEEKKPKKEDDDGDDEPVQKSEKSALDALPPSSFNLFDFKTLFVNAPEKQEALDFFWKNFDAAGYSIYWVQYQKAEGEGTILWQFANQMNGFLQKLDNFRKYAFGVHGVYGEEPTLEIKGVFVWRGVGIPQEIKDLDSFDYHTWTKLDHSVEADKKKVNAYWSHLVEEQEVEGLKIKQAKYFK